MRLCKICGKELKTTNKQALYCGTACRSKAYRFNSPEKYKAKSERYRENNREKVRHSNRKYYKTDKGKANIIKKLNNPKRKEYFRTWQKDNKIKVRKYSHNFRTNNPDKYKHIRKKYDQSIRGRLLNRKKAQFQRAVVKNNWDHNKIIPIIKEHNNKCPLCKGSYGDNLENMELGHILPLSKYLEYACNLDNIIPICKHCNRTMYNKLFSDYCKEYDYKIPEQVLKVEKRLLKK